MLRQAGPKGSGGAGRQLGAGGGCRAAAKSLRMVGQGGRLLPWPHVPDAGPASVPAGVAT